MEKKDKLIKEAVIVLGSITPQVAVVYLADKTQGPGANVTKSNKLCLLSLKPQWLSVGLQFGCRQNSAVNFTYQNLIVSKFGYTYIKKNFQSSKDFRSVLIFFLELQCLFSFLNRNFVIFHRIKVAKHIWAPCCHLAAETGN